MIYGTDRIEMLDLQKKRHIHVRLSKNKYEQAVNFLRKLVTKYKQITRKLLVLLSKMTIILLDNCIYT